VTPYPADAVPASPALNGRLRWFDRHAEDNVRAAAWLPDAALYPGGATLDRVGSAFTAVSLPVSGTAAVIGGMVTKAGVPINGIRGWSSTTVMVTPANQWMFLADINGNVLAKTADAGAAVLGWTAANTAQDFNFAAPFTPSESLPVYVGIVIVAATMPTLRGVTLGGALLPPSQLVPLMGASGPAGLTNPASLGASCFPLTGINAQPYLHLI
jgi:hypothetical protein